MNESTVMLLLNVLSAPTQVLTEGQMLGVLELSGVVRNPEALKALQFAASLPSSVVPATVLGFVGTLKSILKMHPDTTPADYHKLEHYIHENASSATGVPLTFGVMLPFLSTMNDARFTHEKSHSPKH